MVKVMTSARSRSKARLWDRARVRLELWLSLG